MRRVFIVIAASLALGPQVEAQQRVSVNGNVTATSPLVSPAGATLVFTGPNGPQSVVVDSSGSFSLPDLPEGEYEILLVHPASISLPGRRVRLAPGRIQDSVGEFTFTVTVTALEPPPPPPPPPPPLPPPPPPRPIYNAIFAGARSDRPLRLSLGQPVQLRFFIGPPNERNALDEAKWTVNPDLLSRAGVVPLMVHVYCDTCTANRIQGDAISYDSTAGRSTEATFTLNAPITDRQGTVQIQVSHQGFEYDNLSIGFSVGDAPPVESNEEPFGWEPPVLPKESVDLVITADKDEQDRVRLMFNPVHPQLRALFGRRHLQPGGSLKTFSTGTGTARSVQAVTAEIHARLRAVSAPAEDALKKQLSGAVKGIPALSSLDRMESAEADALLSLLTSRARSLYVDIFLSGEEALYELSAALEQFKLDRPIRIAIQAGNLSLPWQLLRPPGQNTGAADVWGFKYELSVVPWRKRAGRIAYQRGAGKQVMFGLYGDKVADEDVYSLGRLKADGYRTTAPGLTVADSKTSFVESFKRDRGALSLLVTYTHAHSGFGIATQSGNATAAQNPAGPRIDFDPKNYISVSDLRELVADEFDPKEVRTKFYFDQRPLVVLNACETGAAVDAAIRSDGFPETFLWMGARGVVATEGPVPVWFGYFFGSELLNQLPKGDRVASLILKLRLEMLSKNNPLGLLYNYFGNPIAGGV